MENLVWINPALSKNILLHPCKKHGSLTFSITISFLVAWSEFPKELHASGSFWWTICICCKNYKQTTMFNWKLHTEILSMEKSFYLITSTKDTMMICLIITAQANFYAHFSRCHSWSFIEEERNVIVHYVITLQY